MRVRFPLSLSFKYSLLGKEKAMDEPLLRWFEYVHLPPRLQTVSGLFAGIATNLCNQLPRSAERTVALRKLLEAKDAAVRAAIEKGENDLPY